MRRPVEALMASVQAEARQAVWAAQCSRGTAVPWGGDTARGLGTVLSCRDECHVGRETEAHGVEEGAAD